MSATMRRNRGSPRSPRYQGSTAIHTVLQELGPQIQWLHSYVTGDRIYCVYIAPSEELIREHARRGGFPANRISEIKTTIDPTTGEGPAAG